jgi:hypothetical protein
MWRAQKTKRIAHPYFPYPLTDANATMQIFVRAPTLKPLRRSALAWTVLVAFSLGLSLLAAKKARWREV